MGTHFGRPTMAAASPAKKQKTGVAGININFALDKEFEVKTLEVVASSPVSCLQGLAPRADDLLKYFHIKTVEDLATWKYGTWATAIRDLAETEEDGMRASDATMNIDQEVDKADVAGLSGVSDAGAKVLAALGVKTIGDLGKWKYIRWSRGIVTLADKKAKPTGPINELK